MENFLAQRQAMTDPRAFRQHFYGGGRTGGSSAPAPSAPPPPVPGSPIAGYDQLTALYTPAAGVSGGTGYVNPFPAMPSPPQAAPNGPGAPGMPQSTLPSATLNYTPQVGGYNDPPGFWSEGGGGNVTPGFTSPGGGGLVNDVLYGTPRPESTGGNAGRGRTVGGLIGGLLGGPALGLLGAGVGHVVGGQIGRTPLPPTIQRGRGSPASGPTFPINRDGAGEPPEQFGRSDYTSGVVDRQTGRMVGGV